MRVTDVTGSSTSGRSTIAVDDVNEAPIAVADAIAVDEDATSGNLWNQLLGNDIDVDAGDTLAIGAVEWRHPWQPRLRPRHPVARYVADNDSFDAWRRARAPGQLPLHRHRPRGPDHTATVTVTVTGIADGVAGNGGNGNDVMVGTAGEDRLPGDNGDDR